MKFLTHPSRSARHFLPVLILVLASCFAAMSAQAAEGGRMVLGMEMASDRRSAEVFAPAGYTRVMIMFQDGRRGWRHLFTRNVKQGKNVVRLPSFRASTNWRAVGIFQAKIPKRKFPAAFYKGRKSFGGTAKAVPPVMMNVPSANTDVKSMEAATTNTPVEADIWKVDGNTVFFFNQLRGLQVLDVANPADPRLLASLRIPAVGEDLYLLPSSSTTRELVLITRSDSSNGTPSTRLRVVRFEGGMLTIQHEMIVEGYTSDSRMVGDQLILATSQWSFRDAGVYSYSSISRLSQWTIRSGDQPVAGPVYELSGSNPVIAAGSDWLAAAVTPNGSWSLTDVSVFAIGNTGLTPMQGQPIRTAGAIRDQFKMQWKNHVLTTISERRDTSNGWRPVTVLENFRVWAPDVLVPTVITAPLLSSLELAAGESLYATRFAGEKVYIVTFLQTDPLWIVDLRDPSNPVVSGHIEVPGWSTYLEPIGDLLFSVGWESNTVAASLFDVSDPTTPTLLRRINLGEPGSYSEAAWDEQALKLLPAQGLAMIPLTSYDAQAGGTKSQIQLLDVDLPNKDLRKRGAIAHQFDARRSTVVGNSVISISQRSLVAADISDRDQPTILSEVALAWPVDAIVDAGEYLLQIENGQNYNSGRATIRITPAKNSEAVLAEIDLGDGIVRSAELRDGKIYVMRDTGRFYSWLARPLFFDNNSTLDRKMYLDVYDATALPALPLLGRAEVEIGEGYRLSSVGLLWPRAHRPTVLLVPQFHFWYGHPQPITIMPGGPLRVGNLTISADSPVMAQPFPQPSSRAPQVIALDVTDPAAITVSPQVSLGTTETSLNEIASAADGLIVAGASDNGQFWLRGLTPMAGSIRSLHVIEVAATGSPVVRPAIDLPGDLFAISELDRNGFLAWTRNWGGETNATVNVSASDGYDAYEVASTSAEKISAVTASRTNLFAAQGHEVKRLELHASGRFDEYETTTFPAHIHSLGVRNDVLIAASWNSVSTANLGDTTAHTWSFPTWSLNFEGIRVATDGDLLVPFGAYGAERLDR